MNWEGHEDCEDFEEDKFEPTETFDEHAERISKWMDKVKEEDDYYKKNSITSVSGVGIQKP